MQVSKKKQTVRLQDVPTVFFSPCKKYFITFENNYKFKKIFGLLANLLMYILKFYLVYLVNQVMKMVFEILFYTLRSLREIVSEKQKMRFTVLREKLKMKHFIIHNIRH